MRAFGSRSAAGDACGGGLKRAADAADAAAEALASSAAVEGRMPTTADATKLAGDCVCGEPDEGRREADETRSEACGEEKGEALALASAVLVASAGERSVGGDPREEDDEDDKGRSDGAADTGRIKEVEKPAPTPPPGDDRWIGLGATRMGEAPARLGRLAA